jgi:CheY-like chemotaxis protein
MARILLIEDNDAVRTILAERLTLAGHTAIEAADGREALDHFRRGGSDLVVTDLVMPETEGQKVIRTGQENSPDPFEIHLVSFPSGTVRCLLC